MSETYIVIVLVPTGTPFSADRRCNPIRRHFGHDNHSGATSPHLLNLYRGHVATDGAAGAWTDPHQRNRTTTPGPAHPAADRPPGQGESALGLPAQRGRA